MQDQTTGMLRPITGDEFRRHNSPHSPKDSTAMALRLAEVERQG